MFDRALIESTEVKIVFAFVTIESAFPLNERLVALPPLEAASQSANNHFDDD